MRASVILLTLAWLCPAAVADEGADAKGSEDQVYRERVQPLLARYCAECHGGEEAKADLDLSKYGDARAVAADRETWERVLDYVVTAQMPPEGHAQLTDEEVDLISGWVETTLSTLNCQGPLDPGRVTLRRLNRSEYNNTIRDLIGIDFRPAEDFPSDDVGYGFDNIGDVLTLSPILMEKYLSAAEAIATRAIVADRTRPGPVKTWQVEDLGEEAGGSPYGAGRILASNGEVGVSHDFARGGEYLIRVGASAQQAGDEPARMAIRLDGQAVREVEVQAREDAPAVYEAKVQVDAGSRRIAAAFLNDYYNPDEKNKRRRDRNLIVDFVAVQGPIEVDDRPLPDSHRRIIAREPRGDDWRDCARENLERFARRAYRRPVDAEEVERLVRFVEMARRDGASFEAGMQLAVEAALVSPHFLFRVEPRREGSGEGPVEELGNHELASRLSYFLWSSMPDDELFRLAEEGTLRDPAVLEAQALRMLRDPKARALVENFAGQWLQLRNLRIINPSREVFPAFDDPLRAAMQTETELFFGAIVAEDRSILDLLDADFTFVNEKLANHYGIEGIRGDHFRRVTLADDRRGGILTQASVLTVTSNPTRTSPVKRGKWILEQLLGTPPPPPPPDVPELSEEKDAVLSGSLRQRLEQHRSKAECATCHNRMDPLGFGLENYDAVGAWRDRDGTFEIDASGTLPSGETFGGPKQLKAILKGRKDEFARCLAEKLTTYALGRGLEYPDRCAVDQMLESLAADDYRFTRLVAGIVTGAPFRMRAASPGVQE